MQVYSDKLLRSSVVVEDQDGELWLVPRSQGGWDRRVKLTLTPEKRADRLRPARSVDPIWIGLPAVGTALALGPAPPIMKRAEPAPAVTGTGS